MTPQTVLYTTKSTTRGHESGAANADNCRLDTKFSIATLSSTLIFTADWEEWYRVLRRLKGFGLFDSLRFGLWLARSGAGVISNQKLRDQMLMNA